MYQAIYYDRKQNLIHLWDDKLGYKNESFDIYAYGYKNTKNNTGLKSLFGDNVEKFYPDYYGRNIEDNINSYETDVDHTNRYIIDNYSNSETVSENFNILYLDIETEIIQREIDVVNTPNKITSIAVYYTLTNYKAVYVIGDVLQSEVIIHKGTQVFLFKNEHDLLTKFIEDYIINKPNAITGWNIRGFDMPYLYNRMNYIISKNAGNNLSPIRKVDVSEDLKNINIAGVVNFDYQILYKKYCNTVRSNYSLEAISQIELEKGKITYEGTLDDFYKNDFYGFIDYNLNDIELVRELETKLRYIELSRMICHMCHVSYESIFQPSRYIDGAILTYMRSLNMVAPNTKKYTKMSTYLLARKGSTKLIVKERIDNRLPSEGSLKIYKGKTKYLEIEYISYINNIFTLKQTLSKDVPVDCDVGISFMGGYVKLPIPGLYKWIFSIDATSLYPSIIRTLGISPESKAGKILNWTDCSLVNYISSDNKLDIKSNNNFQYVNDDIILKIEGLDKKVINYSKQEFTDFIQKKDLSIASNGVLYFKDKANIIPNILTLWFNLRLEYKAKLKEAKLNKDVQLIAYYDNMQLVVKILLNSVYGVLGMPGFRFYDPHNAEAVTSTGQNVIKFTANLLFNYYKQQYNNTKSPVIYGDTDSAYIQIDESVTSKSEDEIINYADMVCNLANKGLTVFAKYGLNTTTSVLEFKREKVCKSGLFLAKKRYGLHVIDSEGDKVDYVSVTGIDIKRSSYPKYFKNGLNKILDGILKFKEKSEIDSYIYDIESNLNSCDVVDLCKTSAVKDLDKYAQLANGFVFKKGTPSHGRAAVRYNLLLNAFNCDVKYTPIQSSEKIKWCYVLNNSYGIQNIGLKNEDNPPEIMEFVNTYIDRKKMFEKELKGKIETFYKAMEWKYPSSVRKLKITF